MNKDKLIEIAKSKIPEVDWIYMEPDDYLSWNGWDLVNREYVLGADNNHYFQISFEGDCSYFDSNLYEYPQGKVEL